MSLRALFAPNAVSKPPPTRLGVALVVAAFAVAHGPRVVHNLPKWHWEDGRHFHHKLAWFLAGTSPFVVLAHRLFIRYTYFGHVGLAIAAGAVTSAVTQWILVLRARKGEVRARRGDVAPAGA